MFDQSINSTTATTSTLLLCVGKPPTNQPNHPNPSNRSDLLTYPCNQEVGLKLHWGGWQIT